MTHGSKKEGIELLSLLVAQGLIGSRHLNYYASKEFPTLSLWEKITH